MRVEKLVLIISILLSVLASGCSEGEEPKSKGTPINWKNANPGLGPPAGKPSDYFPISVGVKWVYRIEIGEIEPLNYRETSWPLGEREVTYATRGRFLPLQQRTRKTFLLEMRVKGRAAQQGPLKYPAGVELEIVQDELGIFEDSKQVFWAITQDRFMAHEVVTYPPDTSPCGLGGPWGSWGQEEGYSMKLVFFADKPGIQIGLGKDPIDTLLFTGIDTQVPQYEGTPCLHFVREVKSSEKKQGEDRSHLDKGFSEDTWFAREKGLVRLEQKVDGNTSMVWTLVRFSKGTE